MKKIMLLLPFLLLGCKDKTETLPPQTYSCVGEITANNTEVKCRENFQKFSFYMSLGNKVEMNEGCAWVHIDYKKLEKTEDTDLHLIYQYKNKENREFFSQRLLVNKMTGEYTFSKSKGEYEEPVTHRNLVSISGVCKRSEKVID